MAGDVGVYANCWGELEALLAAAVCWLDVARVGLIARWLRSAEGGMLLGRPEWVLRVCRLLGGTVPGSLVANHIADLSAAGSAWGVAAVGDDEGFVDGLAAVLRDAATRPLTGRAVADLHPTLAVAAARLYATRLRDRWRPRVQRLCSALAAARSAIPASHVHTHIASRDLLCTMETCVRTALARPRRERGYLSRAPGGE